jgi:uroporphyrinogen-III synthase
VAAVSALSGKRVVVTRAAAQAGGLVAALQARGAVAVLFPTIEIRPLDDPRPLRAALDGLNGYDWVVFTSANAVGAVLDALDGASLAALGARKLAAVGPATAAALRRRGLAVAALPEEYRGEAIAAIMGEVAGQWVLLPRSEIGLPWLANRLGDAGAFVHEIAVYRTLPAQPDPAGLEALHAGVDALAFSSPSTVRNFLALYRQHGPGAAGSAPSLPPLERAVVACIGPTTAEAARECGLPVHVVAPAHTTAGLIDALEAYFAGAAQSKETP